MLLRCQIIRAVELINLTVSPIGHKECNETLLISLHSNYIFLEECRGSYFVDGPAALRGRGSARQAIDGLKTIGLVGVRRGRLIVENFSTLLAGVGFIAVRLRRNGHRVGLFRGDAHFGVHPTNASRHRAASHNCDYLRRSL